MEKVDVFPAANVLHRWMGKVVVVARAHSSVVRTQGLRARSRRIGVMSSNVHEDDKEVRTTCSEAKRDMQRAAPRVDALMRREGKRPFRNCSRDHVSYFCKIKLTNPTSGNE
jgi:hypothetical protein